VVRGWRNEKRIQNVDLEITNLRFTYLLSITELCR
jgi:hypothetical protein